MSTTVSAPDLVASFPFPYAADTYRYSTNLEPAHTAVPPEPDSGAGPCCTSTASTPTNWPSDVES